MTVSCLLLPIAIRLSLKRNYMLLLYCEGQDLPVGPRWSERLRRSH